MSPSQNQTNKPHGLCTWRPISDCQDCGLAADLMCRFERGDLIGFLLAFLPFGAAVIAGMMMGGFGWYLVGWVVFLFFFFFVWEARVLCSHCPYWAGEGRVLRCHANYGVIKLWRYRPEPMSRSEKIQSMIGFAILGGFPFPFLLLGGQYVLALVAFLSGLSFAFNLRKHGCTRCVNFSCPINAVPKEVVDQYLRRNPIMRAAWESSGYRLG
jgi:hypothetical protein